MEKDNESESEWRAVASATATVDAAMFVALFTSRLCLIRVRQVTQAIEISTKHARVKPHLLENGMRTERRENQQQEKNYDKHMLHCMYGDLFRCKMHAYIKRNQTNWDKRHTENATNICSKLVLLGIRRKGIKNPHTALALTFAIDIDGMEKRQNVQQSTLFYFRFEIDAKPLKRRKA